MKSEFYNRFRQDYFLVKVEFENRFRQDYFLVEADFGTGYPDFQ